MIRTVLRTLQVNPGYDPENLITAFIGLAEDGKYVELILGGDMQRTTPAVNSFYERLLAGSAALPGVESVGMMSGSYRDSSFSVLSRPMPAPEHRPEAAYNEVSAGFFRTLRIPLESGRYIGESDGPNNPWVVVVNETLARRYFRDQNPIGQHVLMRYESYHIDENRPREIVGVVADAKLYWLNMRPFPIVYSAFRQQSPVFPGGATMAHINQQVFLRTAPGLSKNSAQIGSQLRKVSAKLDPDQPVTDITTMKQALATNMQDTQFVTDLLEIFAGMALLLASVGIYGIMSYFVTERTHEIGIRIALGAERANVLGLITKFGLKLTLIGLTLGIALALALTRVMTRFLFNVSATDPFTFAAVAGVLLMIALLACYLPGHCATRVDPMVALRHE